MIGHLARPLRRQGVELRQDADMVVLCDADGERLWVLNESAMALWQLCDGETSLDEMVDAVFAICDVSFEQANTDVQGTLEAFASAGLVDECHES